MVALTALAACGGGGDSGNGGPAASTGGATAPAPGGAGSTPAGGTPSATDITCGLAGFEADALRLINERRAAGATCGSRGSFVPTAALAAHSQLTAAAYAHSRDMADNDYFSHTSLDGRTLGTRVSAAGYAWTSVGENIAAGYATVQQSVDAWMASDGHCANLMNSRFTEFGLACAHNGASTYGTYWTLVLARP